MATPSEAADDSDDTHSRWSARYRRDLRHQLRSNLISTQRNRDDITVPDELLKRLREQDKLYEKVVSSREAVIDSEHFKLLSEIGRHQSEIARGELIHFDPHVYAEKLLTVMGGQLERDSTLDWAKLGGLFLPAFKIPPSGQFLYGALEPVPVLQKIKVPRKPSTKSKTVERPKEVSSFEEEETTTKDVSYIMSTLKKLCHSQKKVHYFKFIIDPDSFSHTVENIFHFAFLVKEGKAGVQIGEDEQPYIYTCADKTDQSDQSIRSSTTTNQGIVSLDMKTWKLLIDKHQITEAMIKKR